MKKHVEIERRFRTFPLEEIRVAGTDDEPVITGYAAVFDAWSEDLGGFREIIRPGAFKKTISDGADIRSLFNHDTNIILGRTTSETLRLAEDTQGLEVEIKPPATQTVRDLVITPMKRGDLNQASFGFKTIKDQWGTEDEEDRRELLEVKLYEVSPVTFPAYPQTSLKARSVIEDAGIDYEALTLALVRHEQGMEYRNTDMDVIRSVIEILTGYLPAEPEQELHSDDGGEGDLQEQFDYLARSIQVAKSL